ncbi:MAG TPA: hypothetical protein VKB85_02985, partial [Propionibacteriaceae bacterium]|nr:hypothetical protein [Propionibacteriaceae bacterium]
VWSIWHPVHVDTPGLDGLRWWNAHRPADIRSFLTAFMERWDDLDERETLTFAMTSALAAGQTAVVEQRLMTTIAEIEHLSWVDEVLTRRLTEQKWRSENAAWRIRRLLIRAGVPLHVDPHRTAELASYAKSNGGGDGPGALVAVRDAITHPKDRRHLYGPPALLSEASRLAARYLDLLVLRRVGYNGHINDRTKFPRPDWESEPVPWA